MDPTTMTMVSMAVSAVGYVKEAAAAKRASEAQALAAEAAAANALLNAGQLELDVNAAELEGRNQQINAQQAADQISAANILAFGGDPYSSGSFLALRDSNDDNLERALSTIGLNTASRVASGQASISSAFTDVSNFNRSAIAQKTIAKGAMTTGNLKALGATAEGGIRLAELKRSTPPLT